MRQHFGRYGGAVLAVVALACATAQTPHARTAQGTLGNCSMTAESMSVRVEGDVEITDYPGESVMACPGQRPTLYTNLTIQRSNDGSFEMAADRAEEK